MGSLSKSRKPKDKNSQITSRVRVTSCPEIAVCSCFNIYFSQQHYIFICVYSLITNHLHQLRLSYPAVRPLLDSVQVALKLYLVLLK